ncbi:MAG: NifB/NifX family molybdenum-iron cluster-binding protein [Caldilineaceae bacterium]
MKIAVITDDGTSISQHFGRAPYYLVFTVEDGNVVESELREKLGHTQFQQEAGHEHHEHGHQEHDHGGQGQHGYGPDAQDRHARMAQTIIDCSALLCRGMGRGAYDSMNAYGIKPVVTDISDAEEAVRAFLDGSIEDRTDRLH